MNEDKYILRDKDGDYVSEIVSGGTDTVKLHFHFTADKDKAKVFTLHELLDPKATVSIAQEFVKGFAGGRMIQL